jgi:Holliday junction resolvasome RuvABC DNA-binding subunit
VVDLQERLAPYAGAPSRQVAASPPESFAQDDLLQALAALGYKQSEAERLANLARSKAPQGASLEDLVREALRSGR